MGSVHTAEDIVGMWLRQSTGLGMASRAFAKADDIKVDDVVNRASASATNADR